jgi:outer membrane biogenesis lipoprotein LolB
MKTKLSLVLAVLGIASMLLSACGGRATQAPTQAPATHMTRSL